MIKEISAKDFKEKYLKDLENLELIDVREPEEFSQIKIKWSKLIPISELWNSLDKINWKKDVIFICRTGFRSEYVTNILQQMWFVGTNLSWWINILRLNCEECIENWEMDSRYFG